MIQTIFLIGVFIGSVILLHYRLSSYPTPLPKSGDRRREILETIAFWGIQVVYGMLFIYMLPPSALTNVTPRLGLTRSMLGLIPEVLVPVSYVLLMKKWTLKDLGFTKPGAPSVIIFALILFGIGGGVLPLLDPSFEPLPVWLVAYSLYQPAFFEELFFRGVLQGKLERALGQNRAWILSGILFGLAHLSVNLFGPLWSGSVVAAVFLFMKQVISGWIFGLIYMKTRSLLPGMVVHFFTDGRPASIFYYMLF